MAKKRMQRRFRRGSDYVVTGASKLNRRLRFAGWVKFENREMLVFYPVKTVSKVSPGKEV